MASADEEEIQEPFRLCLETAQGRWLCEELGVSLTVTGGTIQYASGECYPLEVTPEGKLEVFGYRGIEKKSDASSIMWKHKETGHYLTWMYEGDNEEVVEPELDTNLIIQGSDGSRTTRKRKVDYVTLDRELALAESGLHATGSDHTIPPTKAPSTPSEADITAEFSILKARFDRWVRSTDTARCREILKKRGYLSTEIDFVRSPLRTTAANRLVTYLKTIGAKALIGQTGVSVSVRVPESLWLDLTKDIPGGQAIESVIVTVNNIKDRIIAYCEKSDKTVDDTNSIESELRNLEALPVDLDVLKSTKVGVEINKLAKLNARAQETLAWLKNIYLDSKK
jgi:hypothetical protein